MFLTVCAYYLSFLVICIPIIKNVLFLRPPGIWPVNSLHKGPVKRKMFPFDDVITTSFTSITGSGHGRSVVMLRLQEFPWKIDEYCHMWVSIPSITELLGLDGLLSQFPVLLIFQFLWTIKHRCSIENHSHTWWLHQISKSFLHYWPFVRGIHRSPVNSPHKGQWRGTLIFSLICAWINDWVNNGDAGDLRWHCAHYDVTVMFVRHCHS